MNIVLGKINLSFAIATLMLGIAGTMIGCAVLKYFYPEQHIQPTSIEGFSVGSGGSLSPRGDWRAPSDSEAEVWLEELRQNVPD